MAKRLPADERLATAGQLVARARLLFDIWWLYEGADTRPRIIEAMRQYSEFFRFDSHAHLVAFVVYMAALIDERPDTINLPALAKELETSGLVSTAVTSEVKTLLVQISSMRPKVAILRNNLFAHRSASLSYAEAFRRASIKPNELRELTVTALKIANRLLIARGLSEQLFNPQPLHDAQAMLRALSPHDSAPAGEPPISA